MCCVSTARLDVWINFISHVVDLCGIHLAHLYTEFSVVLFLVLMLFSFILDTVLALKSFDYAAVLSLNERKIILIYVLLYP